MPRKRLYGLRSKRSGRSCRFASSLTRIQGVPRGLVSLKWKAKLRAMKPFASSMIVRSSTGPCVLAAPAKSRAAVLVKVVVVVEDPAAEATANAAAKGVLPVVPTLKGLNKTSKEARLALYVLV